MKQFFKFTLATIVGLLITMLLSVFILFGIIGAISNSSEKTITPEAKTIYQLNLEGEIQERASSDPFSSLLSGTFGQSSEVLGLDEVLSNIKKAKENDNIVGIYLKMGALSAGYATIKEVRDALVDFKTSGKFIVSYADSYTQKAYYLSTVADKMYINPEGMLDFKGLASTIQFVKNTLDKVGVEMQIVKVGTYKSAVEPYIQTQMSDANRKQVTEYLQTLWGQMVDEISTSRSIASEKLNQYADEMMTFQSVKTYIDYQLVDSATYLDGMDEVLCRYTSIKDKDDLNILSNEDMASVLSTVSKAEKDKIGIIYAVGGIDTDATGMGDGINSEELIETINELKEEKSIKAVVLRVNSPGGSAYGSEQIWHALTQLKKEKPLIVSMGDYAASGGYYISTPADTILAQPNTLTGSIGIFGTIPNVSGLNQKIGLTHDVVKTNKMSDAISFNRSFSPEERGLMQGYVNRGYELFVKRCADGRKLTTDSIKSIAEGRVWAGKTALKLGLIDKLGGLNDAIKIAAQKANLTDYMVKDYPKEQNFMSKMMNGLSTSIQERSLKTIFNNEYYQLIKTIQNAQSLNGIYTLMPYQIQINE